MQSWSATPEDVHTGLIRIFPAMPKKWANASFINLRAEGGSMVSAVRKNNKTASFSITAARSGKLRIKDNFDGRAPKWNLKGITKAGDVYEVNLNKGQKLQAFFL